MTYTLYAAPGGGSQIVEAALMRCGADVRYVDLTWEEDWDKSALAAVNPLLQIPTLVLPDGEVMTESAAMLLHLADAFPQANLMPPPGDPTRPRFLRWLVFLVAAVYPSFTYGDVPPRFVEGDEAAGAKLRRATDAHRERLYLQVEDAARAPFFLGENLSAVDYYVWMMCQWRPRRAWFDSHAPRMAAIADRVAALPEAQATSARNRFPAPA